MENPQRFVRVSLPHGHFTVPAAMADRGGLRVLDGREAVDRHGRPLPPKPREDLLAATPEETDPEVEPSDNTEESE